MQIKLMWALAIGTATAAAGLADNANWPEQGVVTVCMSRRGNAAVFQAQEITSRIFARVGVRIEWQSEQHPRCLVGGTITVTMSDRTPSNEHAGEFAFSMPYQGTRIVVFYDRLQSSVTRSRIQTVLGHVLAHEIAHILQGISRHSASGIMKPKWTSRDYVDMQADALKFSEDDVFLILRGLGDRTIQVSHQGSTVATSAK